MMIWTVGSWETAVLWELKHNGAATAIPSPAVYENSCLTTWDVGCQDKIRYGCAEYAD